MYRHSRIGSLFVIFTLAFFSTLSSAKGNQETLKKIVSDIPFDMPEVQLPKIPDTDFYISDFGAIGDGVADNSSAIAKAITAIKNKGGGRLIFRRGIWLSGPIHLTSNLELHLESGALLKFIPDHRRYPLIQTSFEGLNAWRSSSPLYGKGLKNIAITGAGVIDGSGEAWRLVKKSKLTSNQWNTLIKHGELGKNGTLWFPSAESKRGYLEQQQHDIFKYNQQQAKTIHHWLRPVMVALVDSDKILLDGPTFQNSPAWNIHILMSKNVIVRNLNVRNPWFSQNGDGLDLESVKNALVYNNTFDVGDDAICIKSGKNKDGRKRGMPTENIVIKNNTVYHAHGGFVVGSEMSGGVRNVFFAEATFIGTDIGIRFKSTRGRGGIVENIWMKDINMTGIVKSAIGFNMFYSNNEPRMADRLNRKRLPPVDETTPRFRNISIENIRSTHSGTAIILHGLPEMNLENMRISNSYFSAKKGIEAIDIKGLTMHNVALKTPDKEAITLLNAKHVNFSNVTLLESNRLAIMGNKTQKLLFDKPLHTSAEISVEEEVDKAALINP